MWHYNGAVAKCQRLGSGRKSLLRQSDIPKDFLRLLDLRGHLIGILSSPILNTWRDRAVLATGKIAWLGTLGESTSHLNWLLFPPFPSFLLHFCIFEASCLEILCSVPTSSITAISFLAHFVSIYSAVLRFGSSVGPVTSPGPVAVAVAIAGSYRQSIY